MNYKKISLENKKRLAEGNNLHNTEVENNKYYISNDPLHNLYYKNMS